MAKEGETPSDEGSSLEDLRRSVRELKEQIRELNAEARDFRLERNEARKRVKELEAENGDLARGKGGDPKAAEKIKDLEGQVRGLKARGVFERVAREAGALGSPRALDGLWKALEYDATGEVDEADLKAKVEAARADYDFLFDAQAEGETPPAEGKGKGKETPAAGDAARKAAPARPAGPGGSGRGAAADGAGRWKIHRKDLQSYDPRVNPLMDDARARLFQEARSKGLVDYVDE